MVRQAVLAGAPDVVAYQELPAMVPFVETHSLAPATPASHSGHIATLVRGEPGSAMPQTKAVGTWAVLTTFVDPAVTVANVHLAPGSAPGQRLEQLGAVVEASPTEALLVLGDTNTRVSEVETICAAGFHTRTPPKATWNSRSNRFRDKGPEFSAYFTRWFATAPVEVSDVVVLDTPLEIDGHRFHLSDHFPLRGRVSLRS